MTTKRNPYFMAFYSLIGIALASLVVSIIALFVNFWEMLWPAALFVGFVALLVTLGILGSKWDKKHKPKKYSRINKEEP
jgi:hypothetical protein